MPMALVLRGPKSTVWTSQRWVWSCFPAEVVGEPGTVPGLHGRARK